METRANYVLVGAFSLAVLIGAFVFILWMAKVEIDREFAYYDIFFEGGVSGLSLGGDVRFNGVKVGRVTGIELEAERPGGVRVRIEVGADVPLRTDSEATLNLRGLTGVSFVHISGGSPDHERLKPRSGEEVAVIPSMKSELQKVVSGAPKLIDQGSELVSQMAKLLSGENQRAFAAILGNVARLTGRFADQSEQLDSLIASLNIVGHNMAQASSRMNSVAEKIERLVETSNDTVKTAKKVLDVDLAELLRLTTKFTESTTGVADAIKGLVDKAGPGIIAFSGEGLLQFNRFIADARQLVANLDRVTQRLESDPARFLLGRQTPEFQPK